MTDILKTAYNALSNLKLEDIIIYDFRNYSPYYDFQIIASASNERQAKAAITHIKEALPNDYEFRVEGGNSGRWILIDLKSIIIHVMHEEDREFYQIEKIFFEREKISIGEENGL
ncbi:MAG: ribosome silencing factor [Tenericutes bacterium]|nr:ribosome silencing factor [Mycoplasmatota bacterium]